MRYLRPLALFVLTLSLSAYAHAGNAPTPENIPTKKDSLSESSRSTFTGLLLLSLPKASPVREEDAIEPLIPTVGKRKGL